MTLVGHHQRRPGIVLVAFHQIVDVAHHGDVGHGELVFVTFAGENIHLQQGDIRRRPGGTGAVEEMPGEP